MKRILSMVALTALTFGLGALTLTSHPLRGILGAPGVALADTAKGETSAEEKKETPAKERVEEKGEAKAHARKAKAMAAPKVDLNMAAKEDLMKLPGVTDEIADKIVAARPFVSRSELVSKKILTSAEYAKIRGKIMVKKQKATTTAK
jgi:DNA uptake protein ComE-like DNA-binding protein